MAKLTRIQHEGVPVKDLERARAFYEGVLGLQVLPRPALGPGLWLGDPSGVPQIHLIVSQAAVPGPEASPDATARHTAFLVDDYDGLKQRLQAHAVKHRELPETGPLGLPQLICVDPDGHILEFQPAARYGERLFTPGYEPAHA